MADLPEFNKETVYDQKAYIQIRLHNLLSQIDALNINPLAQVSPSVYNYQVMFRHLTSCFATISAKLTPKEKEELKNQINQLSLQVYQSVRVKREGRIMVNYSLYRIILEGLSELRLQIEAMMGKHGFNPDKKDASRAVLDM